MRVITCCLAVLSRHFIYIQLITDVNIRADSTAFACGNVFYEILFSAIALDSEVANYAYFALSVVTLVLGSVSIATASQLSYWITDMPHGKRSHFAVNALKHQRLLSGLYIGSLYLFLFLDYHRKFFLWQQI